MPALKFKHVASVSSEDPNHPAENLLSQDTYRKWQCSGSGEKQAVVVLELEKSSQIQSVDLGNNGSAFIEVLVGKGSSSSSCDYQVLLVASSFMSPSDSRNWTNINRVRIFGKEKLSKGVVEQNWDLVKIVCTQPFNKNESYGLSFITLHSVPDKSTTGSLDMPTSGHTHSVGGAKTLGAFALKEDVPSLPTGSLFYKKGKETVAPTTFGSLAAEARKASAQALKEAETVKKDTPTAGIKHKASGKATATPPAKKPKLEEEENDSTNIPAVKFNEILKGVVFSLSGFKNPLRGELRGKGVDMGAEYKPDWGPHSTHLICAFESTPKYKQVKAKNGLVVRKEWITKCHSSKKRLPASKFRFSTGNDSDNEIELYDSKEKNLFKNISYTTILKDIKTEGSEQPHPSGRGKDEINPLPPEDDPYGGSTDEEDDKTGNHGNSDCDTEDEIERVKQQSSSSGTNGGQTVKQQQKQEESKDGKSLLDLPSFFAGCRFFLYGSFDPSDSKLVQRYVTAYNGQIENYMRGDVTHVVSMEAWDDNFDQALSENSSLLFVKPDWIFKCHSKQALVPCQPFSIIPH